ncbi:transcription factor bHLH123-like [Phoenix dactylifera]|uniref:Transcription factor bHLH123-like n=1 Tax=Phoenix dactylifera TaxID=42345 RepID=A0A8B7BHW8_PHODC|nr:transcription factor bHLH123-like [Phoenix dactylifera]XP_038987734.1 transcription factor bHLH123-like [Phoenix dactylifera]
MADDFQSGICSGGGWWNLARSAGSDVLASVSSSTTITDIGGGGFSWATAELAEPKARSGEELAGSASGSSLNFQDTHKLPPPDAGLPLIDSSFQTPGFGLSTDWTQTLLRSGGRAETSFHVMLQEDPRSRAYFREEPSVESNQVHAVTGDSTTNLFKDMNQSFLSEQQHLSAGNESRDAGVSSYPLVPASYGCSSVMLQGLLEPDDKPQQSVYDNRLVNYQSPMMAYRGSSSELLQRSSANFPQFLKSSPPKQQPGNQLQFSNNTPFWNASAASMSEVGTGLYPPTPSQFVSQAFQQKPSCSNLAPKLNSEGVRDSCSSPSKKSGSSEPTSKKPRIESPLPLPTFKVRKEKLGDRITALQQLVSPFGKTDTASVLHEAIEHIKFLHDQVGVLSTPYLKNGHPMQHQQGSDKSKNGDGPKQDLRSRGLCLVPISITYPMASETTADFWHPTFGGTFR